MEQLNDPLASPPSPTAAQQLETAGGPLGKAKSGRTAGQHSPLPPERSLERGPRSPASDASQVTSRKRSSTRRPTRSSRCSPSRTSPLPSPEINDARARQERTARPSLGRTRCSTATVGQSSGSPSSTEKMPHTLQPFPHPIRTAGTGSRLLRAPTDRNAASESEEADHGSVLPTGTSESPAAERHQENSPAGADQDRQPDPEIQIISSMERSNGNTSGEEEVADAVEDASDSQEPASTTQQRRPQKRKSQSATENFRNNLLEQQNKLIATLQEATKVDQALRERLVNAQEKLVDLLSQYFNK
ncbi:nucleolar and coiled-body phosphoprotein 1-like [Dermacentor silvarum]|uniref:nucleolar and coiled-body phosphoprotein 1-like n=1 Tax=Dermacentor silvarum TaxID=543639 RepID=UPI0021010DB9|nr:nucleolar and coiled-body phosphoprotein 1-like [Dermacentor silvarum]